MFGKNSELANSSAIFDINNRIASSTEDIIREAGNKQVLLKITYNDVDRLVEPYSFREGKNGTLFYGYDLERDHIRSYNIDNIQNIEITDINFEPKWDIEV